MTDAIYDIVWLLDSSVEMYLKLLISFVVLGYLCKPKEACCVGKNKELDK